MLISIPYGAIKSDGRGDIWSDEDEFQFLMVRLKVFLLKTKTITITRFQFLMVRLKVFLMTAY